MLCFFPVSVFIRILIDIWICVNKVGTGGSVKTQKNVAWYAIPIVVLLTRKEIRTRTITVVVESGFDG